MYIFIKTVCSIIYSFLGPTVLYSHASSCFVAHNCKLLTQLMKLSMCTKVYSAILKHLTSFLVFRDYTNYLLQWFHNEALYWSQYVLGLSGKIGSCPKCF